MTSDDVNPFMRHDELYTDVKFDLRYFNFP